MQLNLSIYEVSADGSEMWEIARYDSGDADGENLERDLIPVTPDTVYVLEAMAKNGSGDYGL